MTFSAARHARLYAALTATVLVSVLAGCFVGPAGVPMGESLAALFGVGEEAIVTVMQEVRLPRALTAAMVGGALGLAGAALQGLLRNPLADPGVLGVSASASLGAVVAIYFGLAGLHAIATPALAILGALASTALLYALGARGLSTTALVLVGVGVSSLAGSLVALAMNLAPNPFSLSDMVNWLLGSVANRSFADLAIAAPFIALGAALMLSARRGLSALALGEEAAVAVGADVGRTRSYVILGAAIAVGAAVATAGAIGFVGIVAPHAVRPLMRQDPGLTLIPAALVGASALTLADIAVRLAPFDQEMKLGVAAALIGAPAFIFVATRVRSIGA